MIDISPTGFAAYGSNSESSLSLLPFDPESESFDLSKLISFPKAHGEEVVRDFVLIPNSKMALSCGRMEESSYGNYLPIKVICIGLGRKETDITMTEGDVQLEKKSKKDKKDKKKDKRKIKRNIRKTLDLNHINICILCLFIIALNYLESSNDIIYNLLGSRITTQIWGLDLVFCQVGINSLINSSSSFWQPMNSNINAVDLIVATGLEIPLPSISGAEP